MRHYAKTACRVCGDQVSINGLARTSHQRKHVRDGRLVEVEADGIVEWPGHDSSGSCRTYFVTPARARELLEDTGNRSLIWSVVAGTPAPTTSKEPRP